MLIFFGNWLREIQRNSVCEREREREKKRCGKLLEGIFISDYILIELMTQDN